MPTIKQPSQAESILPAHLIELIRYLGEPVLLLPCAHKTKKPIGKWGEWTVDKMLDLSFLKRLAEAKNIGVALGVTSCNLVSIDFDDDDAATAFLELNPALTNTFRTKGKRGFNLWLRMQGTIPKTFDIKRDGQVVGEFRSHRSQTIAYGTHPEGMRYEWLKRQPAVDTTFASLFWFDSSSSHLSSKDQITQRDRETEESDESQEVLVECVGVNEPRPAPMPPTRYSVESVVFECLPRESKFNHKLLHRLQRGIRALEIQDRVEYGSEKKTSIFDLWYQAALKTGFLRDSRTEYLFEFMNSSNVRVPLGADGIAMAIVKARSEPLPKEAAQFSDAPNVQLLIALCYQLQLIAGNEPFFLSARKAASVLDVSWKSCASWLKGLCSSSIGVLILVEKGGQTKETVRTSSRYKYRSLIEVAR